MHFEIDLYARAFIQIQGYWSNASYQCIKTLTYSIRCNVQMTSVSITIKNVNRLASHTKITYSFVQL